MRGRPGPRSSRLLRRARAPRRALRARRLPCRGGAGRGTSLRRRRARLLGQGKPRCRRLPLALQSAARRTGSSWGGRRARASTVAPGVGARRAPSRLSGRTSSRGWFQIHAGPPCLRQADGNGLLGRSRPVLAFADVMYLFSYELARLSRRGLSLRLVAVSALQGLLFRHVRSPVRRGARSRPTRSRDCTLPARRSD